MGTISDRLKWAREHLAGIKSARKFAIANDMPPSTYGGYENNSRQIDLQTANRLAKLLRVDAGWLITGVGSPRSGAELAPVEKELTWVPVYSWIHAGSVNAADMSAEPEQVIPFVSSSSTIRALIVRGTSMNREVDDGGIIIVDYEQTCPYDGALVVARVGDEVTFKCYRDKNGPIRLEPLSYEQHETIFPGEGFEILGRVVWSMKKH